MASRLPILLLALAPLAAHADRPRAQPARLVALRIHPGHPVLDGPESRQQLIIDGVRADGRIVDLTASAHFEGDCPGQCYSIMPGAVLNPWSDGSAALVIYAGGLTTEVTVTTRNMRKPFRWSFSNHVESVLSKQGCNMGACHGAAAGKGGFRLSLRAYDPDVDYGRLKLEGRGRRIVKAYPEDSLILKKPSLQMAHTGGLRLRRDSLEYRVIREWIASGARGPTASDARITALQVFPPERLLSAGAKQQIQVTARFSDGHSEDVTHWARYSSNEDPIARVDDNGLVTMRGRGETAITVWYLGKVAFARVAAPFVDGERRVASGKSEIQYPESKIDSSIDAKLARLGLTPSPPCTDAEFARRAFLDTIGTLPTPEETHRFVEDTEVAKRRRLVDSLLERPEFVDYWTYRWGDVLRINRDLVGRKGMAAFYDWMRENVARNRPWDRIAYDLITASGSAAASGPANFYRMGTKPEEFAETVSQTFLGIRVQCAHCHNHPFEKWTQNDYYRMASFFARVKRTEVNGQEIVLAGTRGEVQNPRIHRSLPPAAFDGPALAPDAPGDRREFLAKWIIAKDNPYFARTLVNRIWKQFMGRGLVEPVDDMRLTNPASNEPLLAELSRQFVDGGFDAKRVMRSILLSAAYQRSSRPTGANRADDRFYSHYLPRRIPAEALLDAVCQVTGEPEKFSGVPAGARAISLPDTRVASEFLDVFGRPARQVTCECERNTEPNMAQALHLITAATLNSRIAAKDGAVAKLLDAGRTDREILDALYLTAFSRQPTGAEIQALQAAISACGGKSPDERTADRRQVFGDLLWAMLSSPEFVYNH